MKNGSIQNGSNKHSSAHNGSTSNGTAAQNGHSRSYTIETVKPERGNITSEQLADMSTLIKRIDVDSFKADESIESNESKNATPTLNTENYVNVDLPSRKGHLEVDMGSSPPLPLPPFSLSSNSTQLSLPSLRTDCWRLVDKQRYCVRGYCQHGDCQYCDSHLDSLSNM